MSAADRFHRVMLLLPRVAERQAVSFEELAADCGLAPGTVVADLDALAARYDDPGGFVPSVHVLVDGETVRVQTRHFHRPMRISARELCALELGLAMLAHESDPAGAPGLRERLGQAIAALPRDEVYHGLHDSALGDGHDAGVLATLRQALRRHQVVQVSYQRMLDDTPQDRVVRPYTLVASSGLWYLVAWCEQSAGQRVFRVDRMVRAAELTRRYEIPADFAVESVLMDGVPFTRATQTETLVLRYAPTVARWILEREGGTPAADGSLTREYPLADREWAFRHVLQYGDAVTVVAPASFRDDLLARLATMRPS